VEDRGEADLTFRSGAEGQLAVAWDVPGRLALELRVAMRGPNGELEVGDQQLQLRLNRPYGEWPAGLTKIHASDLPTSDAFFLGGEGYYAQDVDFVRAILHGSSPTVTWVDGYRVQVVLDAIYRSAAADGKRFSLIDT
jgi:predicted dehydrogenase